MAEKAAQSFTKTDGLSGRKELDGDRILLRSVDKLLNDLLARIR